MKFAKELEQELVPEWRIKYLDYKAGKKYVKAVSRAIGRASAAPILQRRSGDYLPPRQTPRLFTPGSPFSQKRNTGIFNGGGLSAAAAAQGAEDQQSLHPSPAAVERPKPSSPKKGSQQPPPPPPQDRINKADGELRSLTSTPTDRPHYGSIMSPSRIRSTSVATDGSHTFELPAPAMRIPSNIEGPARPLAANRAVSSASATNIRKSATIATPPWSRPSPRRSASFAAPTVRGSYGGRSQTGASSRNLPLPAPHERTPTQRLRRLFSAASPQAWPSGRASGVPGSAAGDNKDDIDMRAFDEVREREIEFFQFLDAELDKVETFYHQKEEQAGQRLALLREQLHEMRNRRIDEIQQAKQRREEDALLSPGGSGDDDVRTGSRGSGALHGGSGHQSETDNDGKGWDVQQDWIAPLRAKIFKPGPNSRALQKMPQTPRMAGAMGSFGIGGVGRDAAHRDYTRRPGGGDIPYRTAKRKLKLALQEFYRGLELLKSYAILNRTAFRKLNKKYDKAVNARPPYRYVNEKVNRSWFVNSTVVDDLIVAVEDLYARYFERGNHKIAAGKLRALTRRSGDESGSAFRNGVMIGVGAVFAIQGTVDGAQKLFHHDPLVKEQASYLLQIYGGYFLMLYLFTLFCINCRIWTVNKVNYPFIFEFDPRSHLDWRQLSQFPSFFFLVFGLFMWLNFSGAANANLYLYYPVVLVGFTVLLLFLPAPTIWHRSRKWFLYSHWRLFFAGLYPVEFRDFFLGDIYCSLIYSTCNIELFFCIYANAWGNPAQCNSSHSRLLGFFSTLPPIWRLLQCLRRYHDTKNVFPHLVNGGKYTMTILGYVALSLYRIRESHSNLALFITFSTINSIYSSFWDLFMDFSLLQAGTRHFLLRDILALKSRWMYYAIMIIDPILRFSWIFYAIFTHDTQHNTICSFLVAFAEATRRGMWALFRVENEHCANVAQYKASRDVPLPYHLHDDDELLAQGQPLLADDVSVKGDGQALGADGAPTLASPAVGGGGQGRRASTVGGGGSGGAPTVIGTPGGRATVAGSSIRSSRHQQLQRQRTGTVTSTVGTWPEDVEGGAAAAEEGTAGGAVSTGVGGPGQSSSAAAVPASDLGTLRRRFTTTLGKSIGVIMAEAHKQDFEKKRKPGIEASAIGRPGAADDLVSSDEEHGDEHGDEDDEDEEDDEDDEDDAGVDVGDYDGNGGGADAGGAYDEPAKAGHGRNSGFRDEPSQAPRPPPPVQSSEGPATGHDSPGSPSSARLVR